MKSVDQQHKPEKGPSSSAEALRKKNIQANLKVSEPGDPHEKEADAVADKVVSSDNTAENTSGASPSISRLVQRQEEEEEVQASHLVMRQEEEEEEMQMKPWIMKQVEEEEEEEEEMMQPKSGDKVNSAPSWVSRQLKNNSGGAPLPGKTRSFMESRIGADFDHVRIHTDDKAAEMNNTLNARAFTNRDDIYFNRGQYDPSTKEGKHLLAHELTHVVQQGSGLNRQVEEEEEMMQAKAGENLIQRDEQAPEGGEETEAPASEQVEDTEAEVTPEPEATSTTDPVTGFIADLIEDQLSDSSLRGHLSSLGDTLEELAEEDVRQLQDMPGDAGRRLSALHVSEAFEITAREILADPELRNLREQIVSRVRENPELALASALAAILVAALADIDVAHEDEFELGRGFTIGGAFDFGSVQSLEFNKLELFAQYANDHFRTRITNTLETDEESGDLSYTARGDFRIGDELANIAGRVSINSDGEIVLHGSLTGGFDLGGDNQLLFTAGLEHSFAEDETIFSPEVSGRIGLGSDHHLRLGASAELTAGSGLTGMTGFLEIENEYIILRIDGTMTGLEQQQAILPPAVPEVGGEPVRDMRVQGTLVVPLW